MTSDDATNHSSGSRVPPDGPHPPPISEGPGGCVWKIIFIAQGGAGNRPPEVRVFDSEPAFRDELARLGTDGAGRPPVTVVTVERACVASWEKVQ